MTKKTVKNVHRDGKEDSQDKNVPRHGREDR